MLNSVISVDQKVEKMRAVLTSFFSLISLIVVFISYLHIYSILLDKNKYLNMNESIKHFNIYTMVQNINLSLLSISTSSIFFSGSASHLSHCSDLYSTCPPSSTTHNATHSDLTPSSMNSAHLSFLQHHHSIPHSKIR